MEKILKKNEGITLIALVITIIILLLLASVGIAMLTGDNGLMKKAVEAKDTHNEKQVKEKVELLLAEYEIERAVSNKTLLTFLEENKTKQNIEEITDNGDGTYELVLDGYIVTVDEKKLKVEQIEEETQFKKDTKGKAEFIVTPDTGYNSAVKVSIEIEDSISMYTIQYNLVDNKKESSNWITYVPGTLIDISENQIIYGRIINLQTNEEGNYFRKEINNIDKEKPKKAKITFDNMTVDVNETIKATVTHEDEKSGIDITKCKYILNDSETEIGMDSTSWNSAVAFIENDQTIDIVKATAGTYYLHVLSVDMLGNKIETVSDKIKIKGPIYYLNKGLFAYDWSSERMEPSWF